MINLRKPPTLKKGPATQSKRVVDRSKALGSLLSTIDKHKEKAAAGFRDRFADELRAGETAPDPTLSLELGGRSVQTAFELLDQADAAYCRQVTRRRHLQADVVTLAGEEIYPQLVEVRRAIDWRFGRAGRNVHRMTEPTRRKPARQQPQLEQLVRVLERWQDLPKPERPSAPEEPEKWLAQLRPGSRKLKKMLRELDEQGMIEAGLRDSRDFELESFDVVYADAVAYVRSVFRMAGIDDKISWNLLPFVQRRRLKRKARRESEARDEGRRG